MSSLCNKLFLFIKMKHALGSVFSPNTRTQNFELLASWHDCAGSIKEARNQAHFISTHESKLTLSGTRNPYVIYCGNIKPWFLRTYCRLLHQSCLQSLASIFRLGRALKLRLKEQRHLQGFNCFGTLFNLLIKINKGFGNAEAMINKGKVILTYIGIFINSTLLKK